MNKSKSSSHTYIEPNEIIIDNEGYRGVVIGYNPLLHMYQIKYDEVGGKKVKPDGWYPKNSIRRDINVLISSMNEKLDMQINDWPELFTNEMHFSQNENGYLCFNNLPLYKGTDLVLKSIEITINHFIFYFDKDRFIKIELLWKEDTEPVINSVMFGYSLQNDEDYIDQI